MKEEMFDIKKIGEIIRNEILSNRNLDDHTRKNYESMAKSIEDVTCSNIYKVHSPLELAKMLREEADRFLKLSREFHHESVDYTKENMGNIRFDERVSRLFLGISCELILKSAFLLNGYCIHIVRRKNKVKKFPFKFNDLSDSDVCLDRTQNFNILIDNLELIFPNASEGSDSKTQSFFPPSHNLELIFPNASEGAVKFLKIHLRIAKEWRDNVSHLGIRHLEDPLSRDLIVESFETIRSWVDVFIIKQNKD